MKQQNEDVVKEEFEQEETLFDDGFNINGDEENESIEEQFDSQKDTSQQSEAVQQQEDVQQEPVTKEESVPIYDIPEQQTQQAQTDISHTENPKTNKLNFNDLTEDVQVEIDSLRKLNPQAAEIALEDSKDGEILRERLEGYGAELALDKAENIISERKRIQEEAERINAHNENFHAVLKREHPDYFALLNDKSRQAEASQYIQSIYQWIKEKPYYEAAPLLAVAESGRDPVQVAALITQFKREKGKGNQAAWRPDPTGALAVPGRGAPIAPTGVGDKDDFDAGFNL